MIHAFRDARPDVDLTLLEMTTFEQLAALKEGRIDIGFGRIPFEDASLYRLVLRNETIVVAVPQSHTLARHEGGLSLDEIAGETLILYPKSPRPSFADQILALYRRHEVRAGAIHEVKELQTALGLVAAGVGICLVPASVERLRRDNVVYLSLNESDAVSPIIMSSRLADTSTDIALILKLVKKIYKSHGIQFGV